MARWMVNVLGGPNESAFELSVVRENFLHGRKSYGWFGPDKHMITHGDAKFKSIDPDVWDELIALAVRIARKWNEDEEARTPASKGFKFTPDRTLMDLYHLGPITKIRLMEKRDNDLFLDLRGEHGSLVGWLSFLNQYLDFKPNGEEGSLAELKLEKLAEAMDWETMANFLVNSMGDNAALRGALSRINQRYEGIVYIPPKPI